MQSNRTYLWLKETGSVTIEICVCDGSLGQAGALTGKGTDLAERYSVAPVFFLIVDLPS